jgi:uncharacterized protein YuzE
VADPVIQEEQDPDGRRVVLDEAGWHHVVAEHPEMAPHAAGVMATIAQPDHRESDPRPSRERFWRERLGPSRWLFVVVEPSARGDGIRSSRRPARLVDGMTITIGNITFDHATYDDRGDVLYLHVGDRQAAADSLGTPEGHAVRYNADSDVIGVTIVNARWLLDRDGKITITIPERIDVSAAALAPAMASPAA